MGGFLDSLKIKKRLESMADDAGKSVLSALTPKAPFPLSTSSLTNAAESKAKAGFDTAESKARSKAGTLQDNTVGKVTTAVKARVAGEVDRVEKKVDGKVAAVEKKVDDTIDGVGKGVDSGIASANTSLDKALGRTEAKDAADAPEVATVAAAEAKDGADGASVPRARSRGRGAGRARSNAVVIGAGRARSNAVVADPAAPEAAVDTEAKTDAETEAAPAAETAVEAPAAAEAAAEAAGEVKDDENSDAAVAADAEVDLDGLANTAAAERLAEDEKARAAQEAEEAAQAEAEQDELPDEKDEPVDPSVAAEPELTDDELKDLGEQHKGETDDQDKARLEFKKKIRGIDNELRHLLGGALTTKSTSKDTDDPWIAYFIASTKFKKKIAVRDLKDELAGKKADPKEDATSQEDTKADDEVTAEEEPEASGPESQDETEVVLAGGSLRRGTASKDAGEPVDTTGADLDLPEGRQIYVADKSNKLFIGYRKVKDNDHAQLLGLDETVVSGEIRVEHGKVDFMSNDQSGEGETAEPFVALLRSMRDTGGIPMKFNVFEASKKNETTAEKLLEEADKAAPEPEQVTLLDAMQGNDAWKLIATDFSEALITQVAEKEGWKVAGGQIVDATGPLDPDNARLTLQKAASKGFAAEAAAKIAAREAKHAASVAATANA